MDVVEAAVVGVPAAVVAELVDAGALTAVAVGWLATTTPGVHALIANEIAAIKLKCVNHLLILISFINFLDQNSHINHDNIISAIVWTDFKLSIK